MTLEDDCLPSQVGFSLPAAHVHGRGELCTSALCLVLAWVKLWPRHNQAMGIHCEEMAFGRSPSKKLLNFCPCPASFTLGTGHQLVNERMQFSFSAPLWRLFRLSRGRALPLAWGACCHLHGARGPPFPCWETEVYSERDSGGLDSAGREEARSHDHWLLDGAYHLQGCSKYRASQSSWKPLENLWDW